MEQVLEMKPTKPKTPHLEQVQETINGKLVRVPIAVWKQLQDIRVQVAQEEGVIVGSFAEVIQRLIDEHNDKRAG
jgi:hypothetical protein